MNYISAARGLSNIPALDDLVEKHRKHALMYDFSLGDINVDLIKYPDFIDSTYWLYMVLVADSGDFISYMKNNNIDCSKVHARNDSKELFKYYKRNLPGVDYFYKHQVAIPVGWWLSNQDVNYIIETIRRYKNG